MDLLGEGLFKFEALQLGGGRFLALLQSLTCNLLIPMPIASNLSGVSLCSSRTHVSLNYARNLQDSSKCVLLSGLGIS
eukprot:2954246-Amphidinium_carterae.1